jgi:hypothetical protein
MKKAGAFGWAVNEKHSAAEKDLQFANDNEQAESNGKARGFCASDEPLVPKNL